MEFACGFVYVPPSTNKKVVQKKSPVPIKVSALLPPQSRLRPCNRPAPPPSPAAVLQKPQPPLSVSKITESILKIKDVKTAPNPSKLRTALLPPNMHPIQPIPIPPPTQTSNSLTYDLPKEEPDSRGHPMKPGYSNNFLIGSRGEIKLPNKHSTDVSGSTQKSAPALPPRPSFMKTCPEYIVLLPDSSSSTRASSFSPSTPSLPPTTGSGPLLGNPNVILVGLGTLVSEEHELLIQGEPTSCSQCGSVLDSIYDNVVDVCYFCQPMEPSTHSCIGCKDSVFLLTPGDKDLTPTGSLLLLCIDISGSMSITSQVLEGKQRMHRSRLEFVQEAVLQIIQKLSKTQPHTHLGIITFNNQVTLHGYEDFPSSVLSDVQLTDSDYLKEVGFKFPSPPPVSRIRDCLQKEIVGLAANGATALGPAALVAIAMASRQPGSKVIIVTDGKANTSLGNLEVENNTQSLLASIIFYQDLGTYAASQGVTVSVLAIEGTDCRLDELGKLSDHTGGKVVIACPHELYTEFEEIIENRTIATHCSATLLLPKNLSVMGEREAGHKGTREVGNVTSNTEITFQFGVSSSGDVTPPAVGSRLSIQLQLRYRQKDGGSVLRVLTSERVVTDDSSDVLSSLQLTIIQLNSSQASAALAVRGRFQDARREGEMQRVLIERALEYNRSAEDKNIYSQWVKTMDPIHNGLYNYTRRQPIQSDSQQTLTDTGAVLFYTMKNSNRNALAK